MTSVMERKDQSAVNAGVQATYGRVVNEQLAGLLDRQFSRARNKEIVSWEGQRYQLCLTPAINDPGRWVRHWQLI